MGRRGKVLLLLLLLLRLLGRRKRNRLTKRQRGGEATEPHHVADASATQLSTGKLVM